MVRKTNKLTTNINLNINVNIIKQYIQKYIKLNNLKSSDYKKPNNNLEHQPEINETSDEDHKYISVGNSHVTITSLVEQIINQLISDSIVSAEKNNTGLYIINYDRLRFSLLTVPNLKDNFMKYDYGYDHQINYSEILSPNYNYMINYIDKIHPKSIHIIESGINYINYILIRLINDILNAMKCILLYNKKTFFNAKMVIVACSILLTNPLQSTINVKLEETIGFYTEFLKEIKQNNKIKQGNDNKLERDAIAPLEDEKPK